MVKSDPAKFIIKSVIFIIPFIIIILSEFLLPIDYFNFRVWEALSVVKLRGILPGPFYPNKNIEKIEEGDLAHHTPWAQKRKVIWITDNYGFRNERTYAKPQIVIIGDSNTAGSSLSQKQTISSVLGKKLNMNVYSFAPASINDFLQNKRFHENQPLYVVVATIERSILKLPKPKTQKFNSYNQLKNKIILDFQNNTLFLKFAESVDRIYKANMYHAVRAAIFGRSILGKPAVDGSMYFFQGESANRYISDDKIDNIVLTIMKYKTILNSKNIKFIFLPIPNKENIYFDLLKTKEKPTFLMRLISKLKKRNIDVIDTQSRFEKSRHDNKQLLYDKDETHWNAEGVTIAAELLAEYIKKQHYNLTLF